MKTLLSNGLVTGKSFNVLVNLLRLCLGMLQMHSGTRRPKTKVVVTVVNKLTSLQHKAINCKSFRGNFHTDLLKTANQPMTHPVESIVISLGNEPADVLGFKTEEQIEKALIPLMAEVFQNETISFN